MECILCEVKTEVYVYFRQMSVFRVLNNRRKHHVHIVKINKDRIPKNVLNMKLKENAHKEDQDQDWKNRLGKMSHRWKKWRKSSFGKTN
jgi:hypothetical protein